MKRFIVEHCIRSTVLTSTNLHVLIQLVQKKDHLTLEIPENEIDYKDVGTMLGVRNVGRGMNNDNTKK